MLAVLLALAAAVGYGGSDYAAGLAARRASVVRVTVLSEATSVVLLGRFSAAGLRTWRRCSGRPVPGSAA